jgi:hypothetical protein
MEVFWISIAIKHKGGMIKSAYRTSADNLDDQNSREHKE